MDLRHLASKQPSGIFRELTAYIAGGLAGEGFRLFENGGCPLLERRQSHYRHEIVIVPAPKMLLRKGLPFSVRIHLSSTEISKVRSRFWRPACRAPQFVAGGNLGLLDQTPTFQTFLASSCAECAPALLQRLTATAVPWLNNFTTPLLLKGMIYGRELPLVDDSTGIELLLAEFDPFEARQFLKQRGLSRPVSNFGPVQELEGHDLPFDRMVPITTYYKLS